MEDLKVAVCLLPGTELAFEDEVRCETGFVLHRRLSHKGSNFPPDQHGSSELRHHDASDRFLDGTIVLLTCLCPGQRATVLQVPAGTSDKIEVTERYASLVG